MRYMNTDLFVYHVEMIMEVGTQGTGEAAPKMQVKYSKDGGRTYKSKRDVEFGIQGDWQRKVIRRGFGRTKRAFEFVLRFIITDRLPVYIYEIAVDVNDGG